MTFRLWRCFSKNLHVKKERKKSEQNLFIFNDTNVEFFNATKIPKMSELMSQVSLGGKDDLSMVVWDVQEARHVCLYTKCNPGFSFQTVCLIIDRRTQSSVTGRYALKALEGRVLVFVYNSQVQPLLLLLLILLPLAPLPL